MDTRRPSLEPRIHEIATSLARLTAGASPSLFDSRWWSQALINWAMKDEGFKVQLFRFIDVLPSLRDDGQLMRLVDQYFGDRASQVFSLQWGLKALGATSWGARLGAKPIRYQVEQMARSFIAGATLEDGLPVLERLWKEGKACSVDLLGEATVNEREADLYRDRCVAALDALARAAAAWPTAPILEADHLGAIPRAQLSIKISALYSQLDPIDPDGSYRAVAGRLRPLLNRAATLPASVIFDMEQAETKDLILGIFKRLFLEEEYRTYPYAGLALQAYVKETTRDVHDMLAWVEKRGVPISIRLVKGAYWDCDTIQYRRNGWPVPLFERKEDTDVQYEELTEVLLRHSHLIRPAFGTHNLRSLAHVEAVAESRGLPAHTWEYQMIYGMAEPFQLALTKLGRRLRIYTPVGELIPGMAYLVRRLLENTSNESFLRKEYVESAPLEELLAPPVPTREVHADRPRQEMKAFRESPVPFKNEPHADFSQASVRQAMKAAIETVKSTLGRPVVIQAAEGVVVTGPESESRNPSLPDQVVGRVRLCDPRDVTQMLRAGTSAFQMWREVPIQRRVEILHRAAELLRRRRFELAAWEIFETGKPWREADADLAEAIDFLEYYGQEMARLGCPKRLGQEPGEDNQRLFGPRGLTAVISPWNFPLAIPTGMVSAALVSGNPVVFKPSERSLMLGAQLVQLLREAGVPNEVLQFAPGGPVVGQALVTAPEVATIAFTGSKEVGLWILGQAARVQPGQVLIKRVIAEMGGKNAILVDDTADLDEAVIGVVSSFTGYQGQKCSACSRAIVDEAVYDTFLERLTEAVRSLTIGNPEEPAVRVGPLIDARALAKVREYVAIGKKEGRLVVEIAVEGPGYFAGPAVFADIEVQHRLAQEEIFGPVLAVMRAKNFGEALAMANAGPYALTGGLYSRSPANIQRTVREFDVGNLYINRPITGAMVSRQPFGGHRLSGVGAKAGGEGYLQQFMTTRVICENTLRRGFAPSAGS